MSRGLAIADFDNDGNVDVIIADLDGEPMLLHNQGVPSKHWVSFELAGTKSNRLAIGARLKLVAGGMTQTAEIFSGGSYLSNHDFRVHFGLSDEQPKSTRWRFGGLREILRFLRTWPQISTTRFWRERAL